MRFDERGEWKGLTTLVLQSTFSVVVFRSRGGGSVLDGGL
jgi:hypothetical protein